MRTPNAHLRAAILAGALRPQLFLRLKLLQDDLLPPPHLLLRLLRRAEHILHVHSRTVPRVRGANSRTRFEGAGTLRAGRRGSMGLTAVPSALHPHGTPRATMSPADAAALPSKHTPRSAGSTPRAALGELSSNVDAAAAREMSPRKTPRAGGRGSPFIAPGKGGGSAELPVPPPLVPQPDLPAAAVSDVVTEDVQDLLAMADFSPELSTARRESGGMVLLTPRAQLSTPSKDAAAQLLLLQDLECLTEMSPEALPLRPDETAAAGTVEVTSEATSPPASADPPAAAAAPPSGRVPKITGRPRRSLTPKIGALCVGAKPSTPATSITTPQVPTYLPT